MRHFGRDQDPIPSANPVASASASYFKLDSLSVSEDIELLIGESAVQGGSLREEFHARARSRARSPRPCTTE